MTERLPVPWRCFAASSTAHQGWLAGPGYYADAYTRSFTARIVERLHHDGQPAVVLDRTCFYPTSGGQPFDRGTIDDVPVAEVVVRPGDGAIVHLLDAALRLGGPQVEARGEIDWARRFDHMQQHTGQHILSQAFLQTARAETVSFHLGEARSAVTIDLAAKAVPGTAVDQAEEVANRIVMEDVAVRAWFPSEAELAEMALRKTPEGLPPGSLRVVAIGDFDFNACGGTHVARSGEVGLIKIGKLERRGEETRIEFRCGWRALADYRRKNAIVSRLAADFTCGPEEVEQAVARLRAEAQDGRRHLKAARDQLLEYEAARLAATAATWSGWRVVRAAWPERDAAELRALALRLAGQANTIALLGASGPKAHVVLARANGLAPDMRQGLRVALSVLGAERGGGSAALAQGGGAPVELAVIESALQQAENVLLGSPATK